MLKALIFPRFECLFFKELCWNFEVLSICQELVEKCTELLYELCWIYVRKMLKVLILGVLEELNLSKTCYGKILWILWRNVLTKCWKHLYSAHSAPKTKLPAYSVLFLHNFSAFILTSPLTPAHITVRLHLYLIAKGVHNPTYLQCVSVVNRNPFKRSNPQWGLR